MNSIVLAAAMFYLNLSSAGTPAGDVQGTTAPQAQSKPASKPAADSKGTMAEAKELLQKLLDPAADRLALTKSLRPTTADYKALFVGEAARKAEAEYEKVWERMGGTEGAIGPKEGQTELKVSSATTEDLRAWNDAAQQFPGGYKEVTNQLAPGLTWYQFKFVKPGEDAGMAFHGLVFVNRHWVLVPRPWRALK